MRIGLNLLHAVPDIGGGWNYLQNLLEALGRHDRTHTYVAFATDVSARLVPARSNFTTVRVPLRPGVRRDRLIFEHTLLQALVLYHRLDCLHWFANGHGIVNAAPAVVTVCDLGPFANRVAMPSRKRVYLRWRLRAAARRARVLLPMSRTTAQDLTSVLGVGCSRMLVVPPLVEPRFRPAAAWVTDAFKTRHGLPDQFWLYVAHLYPHKNHGRLLRACREVLAENPRAWPLVLRANRQATGPELSSLIASFGLTGHVHLVPPLARDDVPTLYSAASAMIFPSTYEGAGLPLLEAQACGCAVAAADIPAAREFAGDAARFFDPFDVTAMAAAMRAAQDDDGWRARARARGLERVMRYQDGSAVAATLVEAYRRAVRGGARA
jgi:glycosyltransferase involved in cell wall biosynthesis